MISNGIDLGDRSLAVASVELDNDGIPLKLRALSLLLHDGGVIDEQYKVSRIAKRGGARRTRRRFARNRRRPADLRDVLKREGFPVTSQDEMPPQPSTEFAETLEGSPVADRLHDGQFPYFARRALLTKIADEQQARLLFSSAVMHIDRHRGWRNPWQSVDSMLRSMKDDDGNLTMTANANRWLSAASKRFGTDVQTYGEAGALAIERGQAVRANKRVLAKLGTDPVKAGNAIKRAKDPDDLLPLVSKFALPMRPFQQDFAYELFLIGAVQGFDRDAIERVVQVVFHQEKPGFNRDVIGDCPLITSPQAKRAASYLPTVQEWKIRGFVANLRMQMNGSEKRRLTTDEANLLVQKLSGVKERADVRWGSLEDWLTESIGAPVKLNRNNRQRPDEGGSDDEDETSVETSRHPIIDNTNALILKGGANWKSLRDWWKDANFDDRELLMRSLDPASHMEVDGDAASEFRDRLLEEGTIDSEDFETFSEKIPDGRIAYSVEAIDRMLPFMREGADLYEARKEAFGLDEEWAPEGIRWDSPHINHPVLQVVRSALNKSLGAIDREIGIADVVRVEAARRSMTIKSDRRSLGGFAKESEARNIASRKNIEDNGEKTSRGRIRAARIIFDQHCQCAYELACDGTTLNLDNAELDHIVPRTEGAGNPRKNMVACCRECNRKKGGRAYGAIATSIELERTIERMKAWQLEAFSPDLPREMERMLRAKSADDVDLRSPTPTSQVATQIANMLRSRYAPLGNETLCESVNAAVAAEARKSAKWKKSRTDHRHHIVDAAIIACINPKVIPFLRERQAMRDFAHTFKKQTKRYEEAMAQADAFGMQHDYFNRWMAGLTSIVNELKELLERNGEPVATNGNAPGDPIDSLDVVAPRRPIRLKAASYGNNRILVASDPLHLETAKPIEQKTLGDAWAKKEIYRMADRDLHVQLRRAARETRNALPEDRNRVGIGEYGEIAADGLVTLTPSIPQVFVRGAAFAIGSVHHLRVYEFDDGSGPRRAFLPVYHYDVVQALREESDKDADRRATHVRLHDGCVSFRMAISGSGVKALEALDANVPLTHVGFIAPGDEIVTETHGLVREARRGSAPERWLSCDRYYIVGFEQNYLNVRPLVHAAHENEQVSGVKLRVSLAKAMDQITIVRRDPLGRISTAWRPQD